MEQTAVECTVMVLNVSFCMLSSQVTYALVKAKSGLDKMVIVQQM